jgi:hypothetical protein
LSHYTKKWVTQFLATMRSNKKLVREYINKLVRKYLAEAEEEKADDAGGGEENPFAAAEGGDEEKADTGAAAGGEKGEEEKGGEAKPQQPAGVPIKFKIGSVKKYNNAGFTSDSGIVKSISKDGVVVTTQPDGVDVMVNFDDISENVKQFFKKAKK